MGTVHRAVNVINRTKQHEEKHQRSYQCTAFGSILVVKACKFIQLWKKQNELTTMSSIHLKTTHLKVEKLDFFKFSFYYRLIVL